MQNLLTGTYIILVWTIALVWAMLGTDSWDLGMLGSQPFAWIGVWVFALHILVFIPSWLRQT